MNTFFVITRATSPGETTWTYYSEDFASKEEAEQYFAQCDDGYFTDAEICVEPVCIGNLSGTVHVHDIRPV